MNHGEVLKQIRKTKGLTLNEVTSQLNHNSSWLSRIENNQRRLSIETLIELCRIYGIEPEHVIRIAEEEPACIIQVG